MIRSDGASCFRPWVLTMARRSAEMKIETEMTDIRGSITADTEAENATTTNAEAEIVTTTDIEVEIGKMADTRDIAGARILDLAARDDEIIHRIESTHQVVGEMILQSARAEVIVMTHIGGAPQHILALIESAGVMMLGKTAGEQRSKLGNWLPCSQLRPSLTVIERSVWRLWKAKNVLLERPMIRLGSEEEIEALPTDCIEKH